MERQPILNALDELKHLSNYNGTRVSAVALDIRGKMIAGNWCEDYNTRIDGSSTVAHAEIRLLSTLANQNQIRETDRLVVSSYPCMECVKAILSFGILKITVAGDYLGNWKCSQQDARDLYLYNGGLIEDWVQHDVDQLYKWLDYHMKLSHSLDAKITQLPRGSVLHTIKPERYRLTSCSKGVILNTGEYYVFSKL